MCISFGLRAFSFSLALLLPVLVALAELVTV